MSTRLMGLTLCAAVAVTAAGCGSSTKTTKTVPKASSITAATQRVGVKATGGVAGPADASKSPVTIGFITDNGIEGFEGQPFVNAFDAAVAFVNHDLGGIGGHPLRAKTCQITQSEEQGTTCAQQMLNDPSIQSVVAGGISLGDTEILNTLQGRKPMFVGIASGPADATSDNVFAFGGGIVAAGSMLTYLHDYVKPKSVSIIGEKDSVTTLIIGLWKGTLEHLGISKITTSQFGIGTTDFTATIAASGASSADALLLAAATSTTCRAVAKGITGRSVDKPTVTLGTCSDPSVKAAAGGELPKWTYYFPYKNTQAPDPSGQVSAYVNAVSRYGDPALAHSNFAPAVFATVMDLARILNGLAPGARSAAISAAAKAFTGPSFLGQDTIKFGQQPYPSLGSTGGRFYDYAGHGKWTDATHGAWVEPQAPGV